MSKIIAGKYPEEKDIDRWVGFLGNGNVNIVFLWRYAAYCRDIIKAKNIADVGLRLTAEQKRLYDLYQAYLKNPSTAPKANVAAAPGTSWHEYGFAIDLNRYKTNADGTGQYYGTINADYYNWLQGKPEILNSYGLAHAVKGEIWHIQPIETIGVGGDKSKFADADDYLRNNYVAPVADSHIAEIAALNNKVNELTATIQTLNATVQNANSHIDSLIAENSRLNGAQGEFINQIKIYDENVKTLNTKLAESNNQVETRDERIVVLNKSHEELIDDLAESKVKVIELTNKIDSQAKQAQIERAELVSDALDFSNQLTQANLIIAAKDEEIKSLKIVPVVDEPAADRKTLFQSILELLFK
jgi:DNA repair exonuclease SbcCD ATPase subunit